MYVEIDFNSDEAIYIQLRNQIIIGIATEEIKEGDTLPSVRQLAELIERNQEMLDAAEKERLRSLGSGMYLLFLAPVLTASFKLVIDMAVFMLSFLAGAGIG